MSSLSTDGAKGPVFFDGALVDWSEACLHVASFGLHNAMSVFDGIRAYRGRPFALTEHCRRLGASARAIGMNLPYDAAELAAATATVLQACGYAEAYLRPVAWRGDERLGISGDHTSVHVAIMALPWPSSASRPAGGMRLGMSRWARPAPGTAPATAKASCNYVIGALAHSEAVAAGFDDALLPDHRGYLADTTGANLFVVHKGRVCTPIADTFLAGITRAIVVKLAEEMGMETAETRLRPDSLRDAEEVFLTGTAVGVQPVRSIGTIELPEANPVTAALVAAYRRLTGQN
jgi:branched-chain amino acid aminotransferase